MNLNSELGVGVGLHDAEGVTTPRTAEIIAGPDPQALGRVSKKAQPLMVRSAVKKYALSISRSHRAGKFDRVGSAFYISVEAELDTKIRQLCIQSELPPPTGGLRFTTGAAKAKLAERVEMLAARVIFGKVMRHPSVGQTLKD